jgi:membrane-associated phospholipid phosphatase
VSGHGPAPRPRGPSSAGPHAGRLTTLAGITRRADLALFQRIAGVDNPVLDRTMPALSRAADWSRLWLGLALVLAVSGRPAWRRAAARGIASVAVASATANGLAKLSVRRRRPPLGGVPAARRVHRAPVTTSFPSGHAASAAAFTVGVALEAPELAVPVGAVAAAVGWSRVWTGAHYPADVLAGAALGAAASLALSRGRAAPRRAAVRRGGARRNRGR